MAVRYKIKTNHSKEILKDFVKFSFRVNHPRATLQMCIIGVGLILIGTALERWSLSMWLCMVIGLFICIFAFTRYHIGVSQLVQQDETYINGWNIILEFNDEDFVITNSGKETVITKKYREIGAIYMDEKNYYIGVEGDDLYVLPRKDFIIGKQEEFEIFISEKVVHEMWYIPTKLKNRFQVMRSRMKEMDAAHDTKVAENRRKKQEEKAKKKK